MKRIIFLISTLVLISGCHKVDISKLSQSECLEAGHQYFEHEKLNYRTGEYELKGICIQHNS